MLVSPTGASPMIGTPLALNRTALLIGNDRQLRRMQERGELVRLRPGVYVAAATWREASVDKRYRLLVQATAAVSALGTQFSHDSAAAMWRLPTLGPWSTQVHALGDPSSGGRSTAWLRRHCIGLDEDPFEIEGVTVTSLARTLADIAARRSFAEAVAMLDDGLRVPGPNDFRQGLGVDAASRENVAAEIEARAGSRCARRAIRSLAFATPLAASPLESISRVNMHLAGIEAPELQVPIFDARGLIGYADFFWRRIGLIGEADGIAKYFDPRYRGDLAPAQVLAKEKRREERMRRVFPAFTRWDWDIAGDPARLAAHLRPFGLLPRR